MTPCRAQAAGNHAIRQTGLVGYVFPIGTQKQTYEVFDTTLDKTAPFVYSGTAETDGIKTYVFTENVPPTQVTTITVPGSFFGLPASLVKLLRSTRPAKCTGSIRRPGLCSTSTRTRR